ncbi:hypothetical protein TH63_00390 [Rufibacter radiotolerans]|uniref:STAS/SEC14 domain-containing protein n=1 Tax=Rufibacter radiotolerans TaxID=1379910 RepID=A0A0H4WA77_9BACT|nr:hypothetical protein [Rufibacter radiotolerans]AKQ47386.1 hypothetical protein TH63_00390 [Rufibacter radiotolerans]
MTQELTNSFGKVFLTIKVDTENKWVHVTWMGYLTPENIKTGAAAYVAALKKAGFSRVLNDTRLVIGSWDHSIDWVINEWAPQAAKDGLRYFSMLTTPESFADASALAFCNSLTAFQCGVFAEVEDAKKWLAKPYVEIS